ncbi:MAG: cytochrome P450 [Porphyrobacter sp.]|nr:cytochrome P450 [Porphyrobacter sp.]
MATMAVPLFEGVLEPARIDPLDVTRADLWAEDRWQEPMRQLRAKGPIHWNDASKFGPHWAVVHYKPIQHIEALPRIFSSSWEYGDITIERDETKEHRSHNMELPMFIAMDPPKHTAQRRTVAPAFGPAEIERMREGAVTRTSAVLDCLPIGKAFDWVEAVSIELTTQMLAILFDFPWEERHKLTHWSDVGGDIEIGSTPEGRLYRQQTGMEMAGAFMQLWQHKAQNPGGNDLVSIMLQSDAMSHMEPQEFLANLVLLIVGGNDTTRNSMSALAWGLHQYPDQRAILEANHSPELAVNAMHEIIRWQTPLSHMRRTATEDTEICGQAIRKHDRIALWYASANRDESIFPDGDHIRVERENARRHLAFGYGIHRCVGARLAELQLTTLIGELQKRRLRINVVEAPEIVPACFVHGYKRMMVELEKY